MPFSSRPRNGVGLAGDLGLELLAGAEQVEALRVELGGALGLKRPELVTVDVRLETASFACAERSGSSSPRQVTRAPRMAFSSASSRSASSAVMIPASHVLRSRYSRSRSSGSPAASSASRSASTCGRLNRSA